ncbi:hypothetical protein PsYK624_108260 [Phanerochaete sordida]|uniref:Uncharacterized protein n=1 Tax=Phanerochaete sordida TaxID=48140 RepID=A0A9P3GGQ7_9APHY|nr:hypothetical protein PsYK624_108260 [Phanerochaete sordida]
MQACRWHRTRRRRSTSATLRCTMPLPTRVEAPEGHPHTAPTSLLPKPGIDSRSCTGWQISLTHPATREPRHR